MALPAKSFFELTLGSWLVMNPNSPYGKEFSPYEIRALLETGMNQVVQKIVAEKETRVVLGQPANYPTQMVRALSALFATLPAVKAAYLCLMQRPSSSDAPSLVVGLEGDESLLADVMRQAGSVAADTVPQNTIVDFSVLRKGERGISQYMLESVKPFYTRQLQ